MVDNPTTALTCVEQAMNWERMSGERLSDDDRAYVWNGGEFIPPHLRGPTVRRRLTSMQRKGGERTRAKLAGKQVRIWSSEHGAYWRPDRAGYTVHKAAAGIYAAEDAWAATRHCGPEKQIVFEVVQ